jgi:hypothetical protein
MPVVIHWGKMGGIVWVDNSELLLLRYSHPGISDFELPEHLFTVPPRPGGIFLVEAGGGHADSEADQPCKSEPTGDEKGYRDDH